MSDRLKGKVAVVTGGGGGIGRGIVLALASEGAQLVVNDLGKRSMPGNPRAADLVVEEVIKSGAKAVANDDDVSVMAGGQSIIKTAIDHFGRIDILVCCAANYKISMIDETSEEEWDKTINIHIKGHFSCIKAAVPYMKAQKSGCIIPFSSRGAFGYGSSAAYSVAKAGIMGLTSSLAMELGKHGIRVNCISPSATTPLFPKPKIAYGGIPAPKPADPEMVAPMVVYLCTDDARNISGEFFYAGGTDIGLYPREGIPLQLIRKASDKWTIDELIEIVPATFGVYLAKAKVEVDPIGNR